MTIEELNNIFTAYNETEDFRIAVVALDKEEAMDIAREYGNDSHLKDDWKISELKAEDKFDCDYIVTYAGN